MRGRVMVIFCEKNVATQPVDQAKKYFSAAQCSSTIVCGHPKTKPIREDPPFL